MSGLCVVCVSDYKYERSLCVLVSLFTDVDLMRTDRSLCLQAPYQYHCLNVCHAGLV